MNQDDCGGRVDALRCSRRLCTLVGLPIEALARPGNEEVVLAPRHAPAVYEKQPVRPNAPLVVIGNWATNTVSNVRCVRKGAGEHWEGISRAMDG